MQLRLKVIACEVIAREVCFCLAHSPHIIDPEFTPKDGHDHSAWMRADLQSRIDTASNLNYDAILLGFGLCGNVTVGLQARSIPLVIPRAHDCCTLFLGCKDRFRELFSENPSQPFSSQGYFERGDGYVHSSSLRQTLGLDRTFEEYEALYGSENASYIMETLESTFDLAAHENEVIFIEIPETAQEGAKQRFKKQALAHGKDFLHIKGSIKIIRDLLFANWDEANFLRVSPGQVIEGVYDWQEICRSTLSGWVDKP